MIPMISQSVSAIRVDPSARGRHLRQRADKFVKLLARRSDNLTGGGVKLVKVDRGCGSGRITSAAQCVYRRISTC